MAVTDVQTDFGALTVTMTTEFAADIAQVWELWSDPQKLERWWGPPSYTVTFEDYDVVPGDTVRYSMTGPEGDRHHGWWRLLLVDAPVRLEFEDGFADANGVPNTELPVTKHEVTLTALSATATRMVIVARFSSREAMEQIIATGYADVMSASVSQMDKLLERKATP